MMRLFRRYCLVRVVLWLVLTLLVRCREEPGCLTPSPSSCEKTLMWLVDRKWENSIERRQRRKLASDNLLPRHTVSVYFHVLEQEDSRDGRLRGKHRKEFMKSLDKAFKPTPFSFEYKGMTVSRNDTWHKCLDEATFKRVLRVGSRNTLNIYVCDSRQYASYIAPTVLVPTPMIGRATFPHNLQQRQDGIVQDGVLIRNPASKFLKKLPDSKVVAELPKSEVIQTLVHEVGHWLGCLHTFEGGCSSKFKYTQYVNGAVGDGVSDTAAERHPAWNNKGWQKCFRKVQTPDTCANDLEGVDPGEDPVQNFMDYSRAKCLKKYGAFTEKQHTRMVAQFETFRLGSELQGDPSNLSNDRRLEDSTEFIPDKELIAICVNSAVEECECGKDCYFKFRDLLRDFLSFKDFDAMKSEIFASCSDCSTIGSDTECPEKNMYCDYGDHDILGYRCRKKMPNRDDVGRSCYTDSQCKKGFCTLGASRFSSFCRQCPTPGLSLGCGDKEVCAGWHQCEKKRGVGKGCGANDTCKTGICTGGRCSYCGPDIESSVGCPSGKKCRLTRQGGRKFYKCSRKSIYGPERGRSLEVNRRLEKASCPVPGTAEGCEQDTEYCSARYKCEKKLNSYAFTGYGGQVGADPCWSDIMCIGGFCANGFCVDCPVLGSPEGCDKVNEVCGGIAYSHVCVPRKVGLETCLKDDECYSGDCRHGLCYGSCSLANNAACGKSKAGEHTVTCDGQFCAIGADKTKTKQAYFNVYDCRMGLSSERCLLCHGQEHWQCEGEQFCSLDHDTGKGQCEAKLPHGAACSYDAECISRKCSSSGTCKGQPECERNLDCVTLDAPDRFCEGYRCRGKRKLGGFCTEHYNCLSGACDFFTQECVECLDSLTCPDQQRCTVGHRCQEKQCLSHEDCSNSDLQVCKFREGECVACTSDDDCVDAAKSACDLHANVCSECVDNRHCRADEYCVRDIQSCRKRQCFRNGDCPGSLLCDTETDFSCVECLQNGDCPSTRPHCDFFGKCQVCVENEDCPEADQVCTMATNDTISGNLVCWSPYGQCENDGDCKGGLDGDYCVDAICSFCRKDSDCKGSERCGAGVCRNCLNDGDCAQNEYCSIALSRCLPTECRVDKDCPSSKPICHTSHSYLPTCVQCRDSSDCREIEFCETFLGTFQCLEKRCEVHADCRDGQFCDHEVNENQFQCVDCIENFHCQEGNKRICFSGTCVECFNSFDCSGHYKACDFETRTCVTRVCTNDLDCHEIGMFRCVVVGHGPGHCMGCFKDSDCSGINEYCDPQTYECAIKRCVSDADCIDRPDDKKVCHRENHECAQCVRDSDCHAIGLSICHNEGFCMGCTTERDECDADSNQFCDVWYEVCRPNECSTHRDCQESTGDKNYCLRQDVGWPDVTSIGSCVGCLNDAHCPADFYCDYISYDHECLPKMCAKHADCPGASSDGDEAAVYCSMEESAYAADATPNRYGEKFQLFQCVTCRHDGHCPVDKPYCLNNFAPERGSSHECVECLWDGDCPGDLRCDHLFTYQCLPDEECKTHQDCVAKDDGKKPYCWPTYFSMEQVIPRRCVSCLQDAHCPDNERCQTGVYHRDRYTCSSVH